MGVIPCGSPHAVKRTLLGLYACNWTEAQLTYVLEHVCCVQPRLLQHDFCAAGVVV